MSTEFMKFRGAREEDLDEIVQLDKEVWGENVCGTKNMYESRFNVFREGTFVCLHEGRIKGAVVTLIMNYDLDKPIKTWAEATDNGFIRKSHNPNGDSLYGVSLSVGRKAPPTAGSTLLEVVKMFAMINDFKKILVGARVPNYYLYCKDMSIDDYIKAPNGNNRNRRCLDPELEFYRKSDLEIISVLPNYFPDPASLNYGILLVWDNLFKGRKSPRHWKYLINIF